MTSTTEPTLLVITLFGHAAVAAACYLAVVIVAGALARLVGLRGVAVRAVDRVTLPTLRRLLDTTLGASLAVAAVGSPPAWAEPPTVEDHPSPTMVRLPHAEADARPLDRSTTTASPAPTTTEPPVTTTVTTTAATAGSSTSTTMTTTIPTEPTTAASTPSSTTSATTVSVPPPARAATPAREPPASPSPSGPEWTVRPGDHFWSIAESVLRTAWQRAPSDDETDPYWRLLVDANRHRLVDGENADLLFAGQTLVVPTPAPP